MGEALDIPFGCGATLGLGESDDSPWTDIRRFPAGYPWRVPLQDGPLPFHRPMIS